MDPLSRFSEVVFVDSEFTARPAEHLDVVCICGRMLRSGEDFTVWRPARGSAPPYPVGDDVLLISFTAAEAEVCQELGWPVPNLIDLRTEYLCQTGTTERLPEGRKAPRALIDILRSYGILDLDAEQK